MIIVTGDTHGEYSRFDYLMRNGEELLTKDDYLIICGDFGFIFLDNVNEQRVLDRIAEKPYTVCFCDGNHENFAALNAYPAEEWNGGRINRIRPNIIHLMRGQVYTIEGKKFFTFGGAYSVDRYMRILNYSYWNEEIPSNTEYKEATKNLEAVGNRVDYIITHTAPMETVRMMGYEPNGHDAELMGFLDWIMYTVKFKRWYFGHWHTDREITDKLRAVYFDCIPIED